MIKWESYVEKDGTKMRCKYFDKDGMQINDGDDIRYAMAEWKECMQQMMAH